jgi:RNA:NAD 2'-phosphotransferase (TPT1/KptA family)
MEKEIIKTLKPEVHDVKLSKALSQLLRHRAIEYGVKIDTAGFIKVEDVMNYLKYNKRFKNLQFS